MDYLTVFITVCGRGKPLRFIVDGGLNPDGLAIFDDVTLSVGFVAAFVVEVVATVILLVVIGFGFNGLYKYEPCALFLDEDDDMLYIHTKQIN